MRVDTSMNLAERNYHQITKDQSGVTDNARLGVHFFSLGCVITCIALLYLSTFTSIVSIWLRSDTFLHGFMILPISFYLMWKKWPSIREVKPTVYVPGLLALLVLSIVWWVCAALGIQVGRQFVAAAMIPMAVIAIMGPQVARIIAFPLGYLVFAVPFGEALIPWLMDFTAWFTVHALNLTGIPIVRDGLYFNIPAGNFEVAKACSGVRYLLATLALGTLYAYLTYRSTVKRLIFLLFSIVLPIVANGARAYGIVLIAHLSDMRWAVGVDHIIYGWIFFGLVIGLMFWVGNRFRDDPIEVLNPVQSPQAADVVGTHGQKRKVLAVAGLAVACLGAGPLLMFGTVATPANDSAWNLSVPVLVDGWRSVSATNSDWQPAYVGASAESYGRYASVGDIVDLAIIQYRQQRQDAEIVNSQNAIANPATWKILNAKTTTVLAERGKATRVLSTVAQSRAGKRLIWYWYDVNGERAVSNIGVMFLEGKSLLGGKRIVSTVVAISVPFVDRPDDARAVLQRFLVSAEASIDACLHSSTLMTQCRSMSKEPVQH